MNTRPLIVLVLLFCLSRLVANAQDDDSRRWAIDFRLSPVKPVVSLNETPDKYYDPLKAGGGPNFSAHIEYFIPQTGFSVVGGYDHEVMDFYSGDVSADLSQIMLGGRWYFLSKSLPAATLSRCKHLLERCRAQGCRHGEHVGNVWQL